MQKYPAPPIFDAIVELRFARELPSKVVGQIASAVKKGYDSHNAQESVKVEVRIDPSGPQSHISEPSPVNLMSNADQTDQARIETDKIHWSRLAPYEGWDQFSSRVFSDLHRIPRKVGFPPLSRIGLRYRNRIDVPLDERQTGRYEDYLTVNISLPAMLDPLNGYEWRVVKKFKSEGLELNLFSAVILSPIPNCTGILLDIDISCMQDLPSNIDSLKHKLDQMRAKKNDIFELCVTDEARATFK